MGGGKEAATRCMGEGVNPAGLGQALGEKRFLSQPEPQESCCMSRQSSCPTHLDSIVHPHQEGYSFIALHRLPLINSQESCAMGLLSGGGPLREILTYPPLTPFPGYFCQLRSCKLGASLGFGS